MWFWFWVQECGGTLNCIERRAEWRREEFACDWHLSLPYIGEFTFVDFYRVPTSFINQYFIVISESYPVQLIYSCCRECEWSASWPVRVHGLSNFSPRKYIATGVDMVFGADLTPYRIHSGDLAQPGTHLTPVFWKRKELSKLCRCSSISTYLIRNSWLGISGVHPM